VIGEKIPLQRLNSLYIARARYVQKCEKKKNLETVRKKTEVLLVFAM
jgi:hypothetical protein